MHIFVTDREGARHRLEALEGFRVMEIIRDWGLDIKAECGGACACATCHVYVDDQWHGRLAPLAEEEEDMLDSAFDVETNSRLSCQILMSEELNGLELRLAPGTGKEDREAA
ncbi:2Fe-2S iron-sulfur cluster-binding protein [Pseudohoeflea coraliihabitans]|uniref:2Fe-2S iron-sulfur cluster binding domain-containing protein n=1 Tax=Pseudohoeflea coraliihabitans TaxID=2860393 RepID=A0ABS6WR30_9HYPH|nr:2Fe-2S iron-sulfur cluster-binding protein [Pseudohoeflea sp. DP4N28-3]MBW3098380.1 2Fe-2S iron-sulfur cluster binding domain-containing protein [Pseudohoeflea sp. DP4N28-3]